MVDFKSPGTYSKLLLFRPCSWKEVYSLPNIIQIVYVNVDNSKWDALVVVEPDRYILEHICSPVTYSKICYLFIRHFSRKEAFAITNIIRIAYVDVATTNLMLFLKMLIYKNLLNNLLLIQKTCYLFKKAVTYSAIFKEAFAIQNIIQTAYSKTCYLFVIYSTGIKIWAFDIQNFHRNSICWFCQPQFWCVIDVDSDKDLLVHIKSPVTFSKSFYLFITY